MLFTLSGYHFMGGAGLTIELQIWERKLKSKAVNFTILEQKEY